MSLNDIDAFLIWLKDIIRKFNSNDDYFTDFSQILSKTTESVNIRNALATNDQVVNLLMSSISNPSRTDYTGIRVVRGNLILIRNLCSAEGVLFDLQLLFESLNVFIHNCKNCEDSNLFVSTVIIYYQALSNLTVFKKMDNLKLFFCVFKLILPFIDDNDTLITPFLKTFYNLIERKDNQFVVNILHWEDKSLPVYEIFNFLTTAFSKVDLESELTTSSVLLISVFKRMISDESFSQWMKLQSFENKLKILSAAQIIIPATESWNKFQIVAILNWVYDEFQIYNKSAMESLKSNVEDMDQWDIDVIHRPLLLTLDIISSVSNTKEGKEFLGFYNSLELFIPLLGTIHTKFKPKNFTKKIDEVTLEFPEIKSILIEIIANLTYKDHDIQEQVRSLGGLELILSNCIIDDTNKFIRERAIVCIRFLLENNKENQNVVAQLEVRKPVDDNVLQDIGYQVGIKDGRIHLNKKEL